MDARGYLRLLRRLGFGGRRIFGDRGRTITLHYRRTWHDVSDVVLVYNENDAAAYRTDDTIDDDDPFGLDSRPDLLEEARGTVAQVVTNVRFWPRPDWPGYATNHRPAP
jgi:hypothetical protein